MMWSDRETVRPHPPLCSFMFDDYLSYHIVIHEEDGLIQLNQLIPTSQMPAMAIGHRCFTEWTTGRTLLSVCFLVLLLAHLCYSAAIGFRFMEQLITAHFTAGPQIDVAGCPAWTCPARLPRLRRLRLVWHLKDSPGNDSHIPSYTHIIFAHVWCVWWTCCSCLCRIHFSGNYFVLFELIVVWFTSRLICLFPTDFEWNHARKLHITYSTN